jgi:predicted metal-dependent HD superfamily phosphohydrolase
MLGTALGVLETTAQQMFDRLAAAYASPGRFYHTLDHVAQMLRLVAPLRDRARDFTAVLLAVWFHDVVYDPRAKDNEEQSAALADRVLREGGVAKEMIAEARRLILLTKTHELEPTDTDGILLVDADLAILGAPPEEYQRYAAASRQEYAWVSDEAYRKGRRAVLDSFLRRPRIYRSEALAALEPQARCNLAAEIKRLDE